MANFPGVNYRSGLVGDGFILMDNITHVDRDVLRRRPGYLKLTPDTTGYSALAAAPYAGYIAYQEASSGELRALDLSSYLRGASLGTTGTTPGVFARYNGRLYWSNGTANPLVLESPTTTARGVGITAPSGTIGAGTVTAGAGKITAGSHLFQYRFKNSTTGYLSNPSGAISKTLTSLDRVQFTIGTSGTDIILPVGEAWADTIVLEVTLANGQAFYAAVTGSAVPGSMYFSLSDIELSAKTPVEVYGSDGHNPMPKLDLILEHRGRLFGVQQSTKLLGWSRPGYPESWDLTVYARKLANMDSADTVVGAASFLGDLYLFNPYGMSRFTYADDPSLGTVLGIPTDQGLWNQRCLVAVNNILYGFGPGGVWMITAMNPMKISIEVDPFIQANMDNTKSSQFFGWYNQADQSITWAFVATGDTGPKRAVTYSIATQKWSTRTYKHTLDGAVYAYQKNYLMANGYFWQEGLGYFDGGTSPMPATVQAGSTTTAIRVLEASPSTWIGGHLTIGTATRLITGVSSGVINVSTPFDSADVVVGRVGFVGALVASVETQWITLNSLIETKNPSTIVLEFEPSTESDRTMKLEVMQGFISTPVVWRRDSSDTPPAGVTYNDGDAYLTLASDGGNGRGVIPVPMPSDFSRCVKIRLTVNDQFTPFGLLSMKLASRAAMNTAAGGTE